MFQNFISTLRHWRWGDPKDQPVFNGARPSVVVDCADGDDQNRGDIHGRIGLARHVAEILGAEYKEITLDQCPDGSLTYLQALMAREDAPDFVFTRQFIYCDDFAVWHKSAGLVVSSYNECVANTIPFDHPLKRELVPHHLDSHVVARQTEIFAQEYAELPRPLVGIMMAQDIILQKMYASFYVLLRVR